MGNMSLAKVIAMSEEHLHVPAKWDESDKSRQTEDAA